MLVLRADLLELGGDMLLTLDALLKERNVTHAAARLGISQPALSARLVRLRKLFDDQLLVPAVSGRGMVATAYACAIEPELGKLIERFREFAQVASGFDPSTSERVFRIAATDNPAAILAPDLIASVMAQAPNVRLAFLVPEKSRIAADLEDARYDLFVGAAEDAAGDLIGRRLLDEQFVTAQRSGHPRGTGPLTLDEFCALDHLLISTSGGRFSGTVDEALAALGRRRRVMASIQSYALAPLILAGTNCICTLPRRFLARFSESLDLLAPPLPLATFALNAFWHPRMRDDPGHIWLREQVFRAAGSRDRPGP